MLPEGIGAPARPASPCTGRREKASHQRGRLVAWLFALVLTAIALAAAPSSLADATGAISGTVTEAAAPNAPIAGIEVCAYVRGSAAPEPEEPSCATTGASGEYTIASLASGEYTVEFSAPPESQLNYVAQYYNGQATEPAADAVSVSAPATTTGIDAQLVVGGEISGTVTDAKTGAALESALVCAFLDSGESGGCAVSGASGAYTVPGLATGGYRVFFFHRGYQSQFYDGKATGAEADLVAVTQGATTTGIDAALQPGSAPPPLTGIPGGTPEAAGKVVPQTTSPLATVLSHRLVLKRRSLRVRIACARARCVGRLGLLRLTGRGKLHLARTLALGSFSIAPGHNRTVTIHLVGRGLPPALANARRHPVRLYLVLSVRGGHSVQERLLVS